MDRAAEQRRWAAESLAAADAARGLSTAEAARRLAACGPNAVRVRASGAWRLVVRQLANPLVLILVVAAAIAGVVHETVDAAVIAAVVVGSSALTLVRERHAETAMERLRERLVSRATVLRDGAPRELPFDEVVPGDVVLLAAGSLVPADGVLLETTDLFVNEAALTGESFPAAKRRGVLAAGAPLGDASGACFQGTSVRSGFARLLVVATGAATRLGGVARRLGEGAEESEFERGLRRFGYLLTRLMIGIVLVVFAVNVFDAKPPIESLLFAMAIAVGISPELLPAIVAVELSRGARDMAGRGVLVRRLDAIESLGGMDVLCTDKTGTLTVGVIDLEAAVDADGETSREVLAAAVLNAALESGLPNPLDEALRRAGAELAAEASGWRKDGEVPYDFARKRLSVGVTDGVRRRLIVKGAVDNVLAVCGTVAGAGGTRPLDGDARRRLVARFAAWSDSGLRVLAVAERDLAPEEAVCREAERDLALLGFLLFSDPPKSGVAEAVAELARAGVRLKMLTGDNRRVAAHLAGLLGLDGGRVLVGAEIDRLRADALAVRAAAVDVFAELDPMHKERILRALQAAGHCVGFLGDGINDAPALAAADVGISVDQAVDVAREAADLVLLRPDVAVLSRGVEDGRRTLANTLKYVYATSSANLGNMVSLALASAALPFLPLLAKQILLNNFLSDLPGLALASDRVDADALARPLRWRTRDIRDFMIVFGLLSSLFDLMVFALLLFVVRATPDVFRSGWFVASLLTELAVMFVLRTRRPLHRSRPGPLLVAASALVAVVAVALPYSPLAGLFGLVPLSGPVLAIVALVTVAYVAVSEATKHRLAAWSGRRTASTAPA